MSKRERRNQPGDWAGVGLVLGLMLVGMLALSSAVTDELRGLLMRQAVWYSLALATMVGVARIDYRWVGANAWPILATAALLLLLVLVVGRVGGGSQRWIGLGPLHLQPSEFAKLAVVAWVARWWAQHPQPGGAGLLALMIPGAVVAGIAVLVLLQPDLGTAVAMMATAAGVVLVAGVRTRLLVGLAGVAVVVMGLAWAFVLKPYQKRRVLGFLDPEADRLGVGYHTIQSKIAVGAGGVWGSGYGQGTQTALHFLPEQHTDFIFSVWCEEWGFVGALVVLLLFGFLFAWLARTALEARDTFGRLLAAGILAHFALHAGINMAMVLGWAPVVGIPLPFITYGGSAVLTNAIAIGLALAIRRRRTMF